MTKTLVELWREHQKGTIPCPWDRPMDILTVRPLYIVHEHEIEWFATRIEQLEAEVRELKNENHR